MEDETDLLSAIQVAPTEPAPRLAYADWLDQRRDHRGAFVRLQVQLQRSEIDASVEEPEYHLESSRSRLDRQRCEIVEAFVRNWAACCAKVGPPMDDQWLIVAAACIPTSRLRRLFAADCAWRALPVWSSVYPDDERLSDAIETARLYALGRARFREIQMAESDAQAASVYAARDARPPDPSLLTWEVTDNAVVSAAIAVERVCVARRFWRLLWRQPYTWNTAVDAIDLAAQAAALAFSLTRDDDAWSAAYSSEELWQRGRLGEWLLWPNGSMPSMQPQIVL